MTTKEVAARFSELAKEGNWTEIQNELFADEAVSIEPPHAQGLESVEGKEAIREKGERFSEMVEEIHEAYTTEPVIGGNHFSVGMGMDLTMKGAGRTRLDEVALYEVKEGKIIKEQFFY